MSHGIVGTFVLVFVLEIILSIVPSSIYAQSSDEITPDERELRATAFARGGDWQASLNELLISYESEPNTMTLFNMGVCYEMLGEYQRAYEIFLQVLEEAESRRSEDYRLAREHVDILVEKGLVRAVAQSP